MVIIDFIRLKIVDCFVKRSLTESEPLYGEVAKMVGVMVLPERESELRKSVGQRLKRARNLARMTLEEVAERLDIVRQTVSSWEVGNSFPGPENLKAVCVIYGVSADWVLRDEKRIIFDVASAS